jgi:hypothetical protein
VRKREFEVGNNELLDVSPADILGLLDFDHTKNLMHTTSTIRDQLE